MSFLLPHFTPPDFSLPRFSQAPDAVLVPSPKDKVAPEQYHATTIFPEYFKTVSYTHLHAIDPARPAENPPKTSRSRR